MSLTTTISVSQPFLAFSFTCASPEECIRPRPVVGEVLDEEGGLVEGVDDPAHAVVEAHEGADAEALEVGA